MDHYSDSGGSSDEGAPEEVSLVSAKRGTREAEKHSSLLKAETLKKRKAKNRLVDARLKAAKSKGKGKSNETADVTGEEEEDEEEEVDEEQREKAQQEKEQDVQIASEELSTKNGVGKAELLTTSSAFQSSSKYLDPSLFETAASFYPNSNSEVQPAAGEGKMAQKRVVRQQKRIQREEAMLRSSMVREGGSRTVGGITIQHLPSPTRLGVPQSLSSTSLPSHNSARKFMNQRLYSKKRVVAVMDAGKPDRSQESGRKRKKGKSKGMSAESKALLGLGMDDGGKDQADKESMEDKERYRKKQLLKQAEGRRRAATLARPFKSARNRPALNFAVSN